MSHFRLHSKTKGKDRLRYLLIGMVCILAAGGIGYAVHSIGTASAKSREKILIYTEEELEQYLLDEESEEYNLNGRYQLEEDLELGWLWKSIGTNVEPFTGSFDGNGHVLSGLTRPLFGVMKKASVENLFLSETMITNPCTYYDGEHYVDGYGALAAYAIDSEIVNCGMGGEIRASNPVETWYQIEKASPSEAVREEVLETTETVIGPAGDEMPEGTEVLEKGPGMDGGEGSDGADGSQPESGSSESGHPESGPSESSQSESSQPESSPSESSQPESSQPESSPSESSQPESSQPESSPSESSPSESSPSETGHPGSSPSENSQSGNNQGESGQTDKGDVDNPVNKPDEEPETVALQKTDRQYRMMKLSEVIGPNLETNMTGGEDITEATPSEAEEVFKPGTATPPEAVEENSYMGGDGEARYLAVTADRVTVGGLIAQMKGTTTVTNCFTCATIIAQIEHTDTWIGGFAGRVGETVCLENSYSAGIVEGRDQVGGFAAENHGRIADSYSSTVLTMSGRVRGGFTAEGDGRVTGCVYDRQMACADDRNGEEAGSMDRETSTASSSDSGAISLEARNTIQMSGMEAYISGTWYQTDKAYPQIEYFALHENPIIADYSRVSAVTLILPDEMTLQSVSLEEEEIILPEEMDGQAITWSVEGDIHIDENYRIRMGRKNDGVPSEGAEPAVEPAKDTDSTQVPEWEDTAGTDTEERDTEGMDTEGTDTAAGPGGEESVGTEVTRGPGFEQPAEPENLRGPGIENSEESDPSQNIELENIREPTVTISMNEKLLKTSSYENQQIGKEPDGTVQKKAQMKVISGVAVKDYSLTVNSSVDVRINYNTWVEVGEAVDKNTNGMGIYKPAGGNTFTIETPEALAWCAYRVNRLGLGDSTYIILGDNIDLTGAEYGGTPEKPILWEPIGTGANPYAGVVRGDFHVISHMRIETWEAAGLVGVMRVTSANKNEFVKEVGLDSTCTIASYGAASPVGALVGEILSATSQVCYIRQCYSRANIAAWSNGSIVGGLIGRVKFQVSAGMYVENCYVAGIVSSSGGTPGAIAGEWMSGANSTVRHGIRNTVWDTGLVGNLNVISGGKQPSLSATEGKTTAQMKSDDALNQLGGSGYGWMRDDKRNDGYPIFSKTPFYNDWGEVGKKVMAPSCQNPSGSAAPGTAGNPYLIKKPEDLAWFAYQVNQVAGSNQLCAVLMNDIELCGYLYNGFNHIGGDDFYKRIETVLHWVPIGNSADKSYRGTFDGNGHKVSWLGMSRDEQAAGLFGFIGDGARIRNLGITRCALRSPSAEGGIGGKIVGQNVRVTGCWNAGFLEGRGAGVTGGIIGQIGPGIDSGVIDGCYSKGPVERRTGTILGGIVGKTEGALPIQNCYNDGSVNISGGGVSGGIVGDAGRIGVVRQCYNAGYVSNGQKNGPIVGQNEGSVSYCFADKDYDKGGSNLAGVTMVDHGEFATWGAAFGLNGERLVQQDSEFSWTTKGSGYPTYGTLPGASSWQDVGRAAENGFIKITKPGSADVPMKIGTAQELAWSAWKSTNDAAYATLNIELIRDINLFGEHYTGYTGEKNLANIEKALPWYPIGNRSVPYRGTLDGGEYEIDGMYLKGSSDLGLIGAAQGPAKVRKLGIGKNSKAVVAQEFNALFIGVVLATGNPVEITSCYNLGTLVKSGTGTYNGAFVGDDIGSSANSAILSNCYNAGNTPSFAKLSTGTINNCYADTTVNSNNAQHEKKSGSGVTGLTTTGMKASEAAASLNTYNGILKTGTERIWYTSLDTEKTYGYPTFQAPTTVKVTVTPDTMGADGTAVTLPGNLSISNMKLRSIGLTDENFTPGRVPAADKEFQLVSEGSIKGTDSGYARYGYANANKNVAVKAGTVDLQPVASSASLNNPSASLGNVNKVGVNIAAAYTRAAQRNLLLEGASGSQRYEICIAIAGAGAKTLNVAVPVKASIELSPDGRKKESPSPDLTMSNNNAYPIAGKILSLTPIKQNGYVTLKPVAKNDPYGSTKQLTDENGGVKLRIADTAAPKGIIPSAGIYYTPAKAGVAENWMSYRIKGMGALPYRYVIEYEANPYFDAANTYGFTVNYQFGISEQDVPTGPAVAGDGGSS